MKCKKYDICYFPKDIKRNRHGEDGLHKYLNSCRDKGIGCDLSGLTDEMFKKYISFDEFSWYFRGVKK